MNLIIISIKAFLVELKKALNILAVLAISASVPNLTYCMEYTPKIKQYTLVEDYIDTLPPIKPQTSQPIAITPEVSATQNWYSWYLPQFAIRKQETPKSPELSVEQFSPIESTLFEKNITASITSLKDLEKSQAIYSNFNPDIILDSLSDSLKQRLIQSGLYHYYPVVFLLGALTNYALMHNDKEILETLTKSDQSYINAVRSLNWFYFGLASGKNQHFEEGTFLIENPGLNVLSFIENAPGAKTRLSSHFQAYAAHIGLPDIAKNQKGLDISNLPENKQTLLFGKVNENLLFIKPENFGVSTWTDMIHHGLEFFVAQVRKQLPLLKRADKAVVAYAEPYLSYLNSKEIEKLEQSKLDQEEVGSSRWFEMISTLLKTDDDPSYRKERVPADIIADYRDIITQLTQKGTISAAESQSLLKEAVVLGIQHMYKHAQELQAQLKDLDSEQELVSKINKFLNDLENDYDNLDIRFGREVILRHDFLKNLVTVQDAKRILNILKEIKFV